MDAGERDELRRGLEAAGCPTLVSYVDSRDLLVDAVAELRSLLRRDGRLRVMEAGVRAADRLMDVSERDPRASVIQWDVNRAYDGDFDSLNRDREVFNTAMQMLETEVPDGQD